MDKPIQVGDLVMVVRGHECLIRHGGGVPFIVKEIGERVSDAYCCSRCNRPDIAGSKKYAFHNSIKYPFSSLIKIDPPAINDNVETREELTA